ncbi:MAG: hypothetical protein IT557_11695 [Alphaproteobacteria bacterium]|nr:hypothetical protein [Alphaproteobacteria bacterium]
MGVDAPPRAYRARALPVSKVAQAYPLVQAAVPGITLERWRSFYESIEHLAQVSAKRQGQDAAGVMAIEDTRGYLRGLFSYRVGPDLRHGATLTVADIIILDLFDAESVAEVLLEAIEVLARALGCAGVHALLPMEAEALRMRLQREGLRAEALVLCSVKPLSRMDGA